VVYPSVMMNIETFKQGSFKMFTENMYVSLSHICPNIQEVPPSTLISLMENINCEIRIFFVNPPMAKLANF
jgi:hypothetical protein